MKKLAILIHVYNAQVVTQEQVDSWAELSHRDTESIEFLIADDCSSVPLQLRRYGLPLRQFRITTDIPWNMAGAKNLLHAKSTADWLLFFDVDNRVAPSLLVRLAKFLDQLDQSTIYMFPWILNGQEQEQPHINTFLIHRSTLDELGGFDEDFCGHYGYEDVLFQYLARRRGMKYVLLSDMPFIAHIGPTEGLNRDLSRNQEICAMKANDPGYRVGSKIRFNWVEIPDV